MAALPEVKPADESIEAWQALVVERRATVQAWSETCRADSLPLSRVVDILALEVAEQRVRAMTAERERDEARQRAAEMHRRAQRLEGIEVRLADVDTRIAEIRAAHERDVQRTRKLGRHRYSVLAARWRLVRDVVMGSGVSTHLEGEPNPMYREGRLQVLVGRIVDERDHERRCANEWLAQKHDAEKARDAAQSTAYRALADLETLRRELADMRAHCAEATATRLREADRLTLVEKELATIANHIDPSGTTALAGLTKVTVCALVDALVKERDEAREVLSRVRAALYLVDAATPDQIAYHAECMAEERLELVREKQAAYIAGLEETSDLAAVKEAARAILDRLGRQGHIDNHGHRRDGSNCGECQELNALEALLDAAPADASTVCTKRGCPRDGDCPVHGKDRPGQCVMKDADASGKVE